MGFQEADAFNGVHGTRFISDLMPKTPIYTAMLAESARAVMGIPHPSGRAALRMLEAEGFRFENYIDIFDGGPTVSVSVNDVRTIRQAHSFTFVGTHEDEGGPPMLVAAGRLSDFASCYARIRSADDDGATLDPQSAALLGLAVGDTFVAVSR
jgi:arginine N-succinyltransferase